MKIKVNYMLLVQKLLELKINVCLGFGPLFSQKLDKETSQPPSVSPAICNIRKTHRSLSAVMVILEEGTFFFKNNTSW